MPKKYVSNNVVRRIPRYLRKLEQLQAEGVEHISSAELGHMLGLTPSQIRQDLNLFGEFGQQGYGYSVRMLNWELRKIIGMDRGFKAILIGVGNIGQALIDRFSFSDWGVRLECAFDIDSRVVGTNHNGIEILHADSLEGFLRENHIDIAVLCVPKEEAVSMAKRITDNGIQAIWNFAPVDMDLPEDIVVQNVHLSDSLMELSYNITRKRKQE